MSAIISDCGRFRYMLRRSWDISRPAVTFVMLNPSTADAEKDDPIPWHPLMLPYTCTLIEMKGAS